MHRKQIARRLLGSVALLAGMFSATASAKQPAPVGPGIPPVAGEVRVDPSGALLVPLGGLVTFDPKLDKGDELTDIIVSRDDVLQVRLDPANPRRLLMAGRASGLTQLILVVKGRPRLVYDVIVQADLNLLRALIKRTVPTSAVTVQPGIGNIVVISGYVASPLDADIVERLAISAVGQRNNVINAVQVGGGQQVQIDVTIALVNRSLARDRGFDFAVRGTNFRMDSLVSGLLTSPLAGTPGIGGGTLPFRAGVVPSQFTGVLQALRVEGVTKFLAEPRVVTQTGKPAFFRVGGQQAIISGTSGITGPGVQLVPFGTELEVVPVVYGNGMIWLEINPRVSSVNAQLGVTTTAGSSVGFNEQQVRTAVMLESGQTYAIGGLVQTSVTASANKIPVLGELPFVGAAFSRVQHQQTETELVILVTPRIVSALNCDQVPGRLPGQETRSPDDYELFLESILEAPRGQRKVWNNRCYNASWKNGPTACLFPCAGNVSGGPNCGPGGCVPAAMNSFPHPLPVPAALPLGNLPPVPDRLPAAPPAPMPSAPGSLPGGIGGMAEPGPLNVPNGPPPVIVIPEVPRN